MKLYTENDLTDDMIQLYEDQRNHEGTVQWFEKECKRIMRWNPNRKIMIVKSGIYLKFFVDDIASKYRKILTISPYKRPYQ